ncbi:eukaryotic mitochondrial regulator protein-domain-containing protein [Kalaharituber pfeilii]|nr:eukaryotic mitochondrial regulator protein-domain-containing protein [Kalaharituber pfeilii]
MPPRLRRPSPSCKVSTTSSQCSVTAPARCAFSTSSTLARKQTKMRREFFEWLNGPGAVFQKPPPGNHNYLTDYDTTTGKPKEIPRRPTPFPLNPFFVSTPVLSDELANEVYRRAIQVGKSVRMVSAELNISLERVAAIVRLKTIEKRWEEEGKPLKPFLTKAIHSMLPVTKFAGGLGGTHEPINDLPSHSRTHVQHFVPVSESRAFTRADAGAEFGIPSADEMIPHPELIVEEKEKLQFNPEERRKRAEEKEREEAAKKREEEAKRLAREKQNEIILERGRWRWKIQSAETGKVGYRYGVPHEDRKRGQVKIPTRVD